MTIKVNNGMVPEIGRNKSSEARITAESLKKNEWFVWENPPAQPHAVVGTWRKSGIKARCGKRKSDGVFIVYHSAD